MTGEHLVLPASIKVTEQARGLKRIKALQPVAQSVPVTLWCAGVCTAVHPAPLLALDCR